MTLLSFNQVDAVLHREIYDNENDPFAPLPGYAPVRIEDRACDRDSRC